MLNRLAPVAASLALLAALAPAFAEDAPAKVAKPAAAAEQPATPATAAKPAPAAQAKPEKPVITLKPGDAAPALAVETWFKGEPVKELKKGQFYIIECWATWCGPCITAIPHVTELQNKYKDKGLTVIGVCVWDAADNEKVKAFVENQGDKMGYRVVREERAMPTDRAGIMAATWLKPAGQNGIPCSFVIDKEGKIAWIGHPMRLDSVLPKILDGKFDVAKEAEIDEKVKELRTANTALIRAKDFDAALKNLDEIAALRPEEADSTELSRLSLLIGSKRDFTAGNALAAKLIDGPFKENARMLATIGSIVSRPIPGATPDKDPRDLSLALKAAELANKLTKGEDMAILSALAAVHFERGETDKAIEYQSKVVDLAPAGNAKTYYSNVLDKYKNPKKD